MFFNYYYGNSGTNPIQLGASLSRTYSRADSLPDTINQVIAEFKQTVKSHTVKTVLPIETMMPKEHRFGTAYNWIDDEHHKILTADDVTAFRLGTKTAFVLVEIPYLDNEKLHHRKRPKRTVLLSVHE